MIRRGLRAAVDRGWIALRSRDVPVQSFPGSLARDGHPPAACPTIADDELATEDACETVPPPRIELGLRVPETLVMSFSLRGRARTAGERDRYHAYYGGSTRQSHMWTPPSTTTTWPVMKSEALEARKSAAPTISSGCPWRPSGVCRTTPW